MEAYQARQSSGATTDDARYPHAHPNILQALRAPPLHPEERMQADAINCNQMQPNGSFVQIFCAETAGQSAALIDSLSFARRNTSEH